MFNKILIPLDGSKTAEMVRPYALEMATTFGCKLTLVTVSESTASSAGHLYSTYLKTVARKMRRELKDWGATEGCELQTEVLLGNPAGEIVRFAHEQHIGLIIMASHGSSGQGTWLLGSIAAKVLRATDRPVLLVRTPAGDAAIKQKKIVRKILVPLDGSRPGEAALCYAERLAKSLDAEIVLIEVFEAASTLGSGGIAYQVRDDEGIRKALATYLKGKAQSLIEQGIKVSSVVSFGNAENQIMKYAEENGVDLIALSSHGRSGIGRWVFGSVTDKILHTGDVAVLIIRAVDATCEVIIAPK